MMKMRDPDGRLESYEKEIRTCIYLMHDLPGTKIGNNTNELRWCRCCDKLPNIVQYMLFRYGKGDRLEDIWSHFEKEDWPAYQQAMVLAEQLQPSLARMYQVPIGLKIEDYSSREVHFFIAFIICMDESPERLMGHRGWLSISIPCRYLDVMLRSFIPGYQGSSNLESGNHREKWMTPVLDALAQAPEQRSAALAAHMKNWYRWMRPYDWKPHRDPDLAKDGLFCDFAFEVALAVCAYDIDDSSFRNHLHYPRDLVDHYRQHIRHTRDAWRAEGVGAGIALPPPLPPKRVDLAKSRRKNFARWVELACDGYDDAVESVLETVGKPRKIQHFNELLDALQDTGHAIHADLKDDDSVSAQAANLADARGIGPFDEPDNSPPHGPARCTAILRALDTWAAPRGYQLIALDDQDDAWHAVLVKAEYHDEFLVLSQRLGLNTRRPEQAYQD